MVKYKIVKVLCILSRFDSLDVIVKYTIPLSYASHFGVVTLKGDHPYDEVVNYLIDREIDYKNIIAITDPNVIINRYLDINVNDVIAITTNLNGSIITSDRTTFLSYKNNLDRDENVIKYNIGTLSSPELEEYEIGINKAPLVSIVGDTSTFNIYKFSEAWKLQYTHKQVTQNII